MLASSSVLKRYALAYIKKSGGNSGIQEFLQFCNTHNTTNWSEENFDKVYKEFIGNQNLNNRQNREDERNGYNERNIGRQPAGTQNIHVHMHNRGLDFWDFLLLQCCFNSLFGGHTTNVTNINYGNTTNQSRENKSEDRKLLALGIAVAVVCVAFHGLMCYFYYSSKKEARKSDKIDYLDDKLKTFRNIEFAVSAISLAALIACAFCPVLPAWSLVILGVNSLVCLAGGVAFYMKHQEESENIEKAKTAVEDCRTSGYYPCNSRETANLY
ncbi:hypothetical protein [Wolbachia endosymbiont of Cimex lectularius]|uniref:hypothetical protein n=1 Tax=Wolbachia endosymbiont of Cimex lectularius TaxID=246273 RepID=UPI00049A8C46|nr:hypothetical protein [Wolbachia endosymbiont of Cimex lectularius]BAP00291.1 putative uncharacterized protein [Wolbachia endosymbiont of Cimex lectularius]